MTKYISLLIFIALLSPCMNAKEIALTIDDLPFVGSTQNKAYKIKLENQRLSAIIKTIEKYQVPVVGFVIAGTIEQDQWQLLEAFKAAGGEIANHTHNHLNLNVTNTHHYIANIEKADHKLSSLMPEKKFFRYPYLAEGRGERKEAVLSYLNQHDYTVAPVTVDSKDFKFNQALYAIPYRVRKYETNLTRIKHRYLGYIWRQTLIAEKKAQKSGIKSPKQILLLHANLINSFFLDDIIEMYQKKGYRFIPLREALKVPGVPVKGWLKAYQKLFHTAN